MHFRNFVLWIFDLLWLKSFAAASQSRKLNSHMMMPAKGLCCAGGWPDQSKAFWPGDHHEEHKKDTQVHHCGRVHEDRWHWGVSFCCYQWIPLQWARPWGSQQPSSHPPPTHQPPTAINPLHFIKHHQPGCPCSRRFRLIAYTCSHSGLVSGIADSLSDSTKPCIVNEQKLQGTLHSFCIWSCTAFSVISCSC